MNEQVIIEKVNKIISEIHKEYTEYKVQFLLEFADLDVIEWYSVDEVEEKF